MEQATEVQKLSKYNSGVAIQIRLDKLWNDANKHSRARQYDKWNMDLDNIWRELARDIRPKEIEKKKKDFDDFSSQLNKTGSFMDSAPAGWVDLTPKQLENRAKQYRILSDKEFFLKRLENHLGKGTAWDDSDEDDFE